MTLTANASLRQVPAHQFLGACFDFVVSDEETQQDSGNQ